MTPLNEMIEGNKRHDSFHASRLWRIKFHGRYQENDARNHTPGFVQNTGRCVPILFSLLLQAALTDQKEFNLAFVSYVRACA